MPAWHYALAPYLNGSAGPLIYQDFQRFNVFCHQPDPLPMKQVCNSDILRLDRDKVGKGICFAIDPRLAAIRTFLCQASRHVALPAGQCMLNKLDLHYTTHSHPHSTGKSAASPVLHLLPTKDPAGSRSGSVASPKPDPNPITWQITCL